MVSVHESRIGAVSATRDLDAGHQEVHQPIRRLSPETVRIRSLFN
jgi:hypothetical protein